MWHGNGRYNIKVLVYLGIDYYKSVASTYLALTWRLQSGLQINKWHDVTQLSKQLLSLDQLPKCLITLIVCNNVHSHGSVNNHIVTIYHLYGG